MSVKQLLVEGIDDYHVLHKLLQKHDISVSKLPEPNLIERNELYITPLNGVPSLLDTIPVIVQEISNRHVGLIIDADKKTVASRWQQLGNLIQKSGDISLPKQAPTNGFIGMLDRKTKPSIRIGIWIMPNNQDDGMLESFVSQMIKPNDYLWDLASTTVDSIPAKHQKFKNDHIPKVKIHTWLAWQKSTGRSMVEALEFQYLNSNAPIATEFVRWFRELFEV